MKFLRSAAQAVTSGMVLLALGLSTSALAEQGSAKVVAVRSGAAQYSEDGATWVP